jgi:hypothetical protein
MWFMPPTVHSPQRIALVADTLLVDSLVVTVVVNGPIKTHPVFQWELSDITGLSIRDDSLKVTLYRAFPELRGSRRTLTVSWSTPYGTVGDTLVFHTQTRP